MGSHSEGVREVALWLGYIDWVPATESMMAMSWGNDCALNGGHPDFWEYAEPRKLPAEARLERSLGHGDLFQILLELSSQETQPQWLHVAIWYRSGP